MVNVHNNNRIPISEMPETEKKQIATGHIHLNGQGKQQLLINKQSIN